MGETPNGWCAAPFRFEPENVHGDPPPLTVDELQAIRLANAVDRMVWAMNAAREAHGFPMAIEVS